MRTAAQDLIDAQTNDREVAARITVRDPRLRFDDMRTTQVDYISGDTVLAYDDDTYSTGVLRIAVVDDAGTKRLWANTITDFEAVWPDWFDTGIVLRPSSRPGIFNGRVCYLSSSSQLCYRDFNGTTFPSASEVILETLPAGSTADISMTSANIFYMHYHNVDGDRYGYIIRKDITTPANDRSWDGVTIDAPEYGAFDAVVFDGAEYVYYSSRGYRAMGMRVANDGEWWGKPFAVVPLDIVDDTSIFRLGHASVINGILFVTGVLKRPSAPGMHVYMRGPEKFTAGRDLYIARSNIEVFTWDYDDATTIDVSPLAGQLHLVDNDVWYLAPLIAYKSAGTILTGYDNPARKYSTTSINAVRLESQTGASNRLVFDIPASATHAALREGSEVDIEFSIGGNWISMGVFGIDRIGDDTSNTGKGRSVTCRSKAIKALSQWQPDADFDYWGQTKQAENPHELSKVIRSDGIWEQREQDGNVIFLKQLNTVGILYGSGTPGDGTVGRAIYYYPSDDEFDPLYGIVVTYSYAQYQVEGSSPDGADIYEMGHNGIAVLYGKDQHSGGPGISINNLYEGVLSKLASFSLTIPADTWHWLQASYEDGRVLVWYRLDTEPNWTLVGDAIAITGLEASTYHGLPVYAADVVTPDEETRARAAMFIQNRSPHSTAYGLHSRSVTVGVDDATFAGIGETIVIDQEQMTVSETNDAPVDAPVDLVWAEGYTFPNADHWSGDPDGFDGYEIYFEGTTAFARSYFDDLALVITAGPGTGRSFKITDYDHEAPDQWVPTVVYTDPDKWTDYVGNPSHGNWQPSNMQRVFISESAHDAFGEGAGAAIVSSLVVARGANSTVATSHSSGAFASIYRDMSVVSSDFHYLTTDPDQHFSDVALDIARKAGVLSVSASNRVSGTLERLVTGWDLSITATEQDLRNFIIDFELVDNGTAGGFGVAFGLTKDGTYSGGQIVMVYADRVDYLAYDPTTPVLMESIDLRRVGSYPTLATGKVRISIFNEFISVWIAGRHVHTFVDRSAPIIQDGALDPTPLYAGIVLHNEVEVVVDWVEICHYVDNFVMNMGARGFQLMQRLVGERRIYFQDNQDGVLRLFKERTLINEGDTYTYLYDVSLEVSDADLATRIRVEGGTVAEQFVEDDIKEHGNLFSLVNSTELDDYRSIYQEALTSLEESASYSTPVQLLGLPDLRLEAGDIIEAEIDGSPVNVIADTVSFSFMTDTERTTFDMRVEGRLE